MSVPMQKARIGFVPANRGFFSSELAAKMRAETIAAMEKLGIDVVVPGEDQTEVGCVQSLAEADVCAELFRKNNVQGIVIGAVNFGEEQSAAWAVRKAALDVPVMIFGCEEEKVLTMDGGRAATTKSSFSGWGRPPSCWICPKRSPERTPFRTTTPTCRRS